MNEHKDDIVCLDVNETLAVTGEMGTEPCVILWNTSNQGMIKSDLTITKGLKDSIGNVALSRSSKYLAVSCNDSNHSLLIYNISSLNPGRYNKKKDDIPFEATVMASGLLTKNTILDLKFSPD